MRNNQELNVKKPLDELSILWRQGEFSEDNNIPMTEHNKFIQSHESKPTQRLNDLQRQKYYPQKPKTYHCLRSEANVIMSSHAWKFNAVTRVPDWWFTDWQITVTGILGQKIAHDTAIVYRLHEPGGNFKLFVMLTGTDVRWIFLNLRVFEVLTFIVYGWKGLDWAGLLSM